MRRTIFFLLLTLLFASCVPVSTLPAPTVATATSRPPTGTEKPTATPASSETPLPSLTPEPTKSPDGVEVVSHIEADVTLEQYSGVRVQYSFDVDKSMKDRARKPIGAVEFFSSDWYKHPNGLSAQEAGAESLMRGIWYAWADDEPNRANVPFEQYMQMVAEYQQGKRPLDDVAFKVFADDLANPGYSPVMTTFDPTTPVRFVLTAKTNNMTEYVLTNAADQEAVGTQKGSNGLEIWLNISSDIAGGERSSYMVTSRVAGALLRLTWPAEYQTRQSMPYPVGDFTDIGRVHKDVYTVMEYDGPYGRFGAFTIPPEWSDKRGG